MTSSIPSLRLVRAVERVVAHGHPWIYRDALERHDLAPGTECRVLDRRGRFLARGLVEEGPIGLRVFSRVDRPLDDAFLVDRIEHALELRDRIVPPDTDAMRLLHGEGDGLPGVVCDRYGSCAALRLDGAAIATRRERLVALLLPILRARGVESLVAKKRGEETELLAGPPPERPLRVREGGMVLLVDVLEGQKTGLFLDHRPSRARVRSLSAGLRVLDLFSYTGGFSVAAGLGGARRVVSVDVSAPALELARAGFVANGLDPESLHETHAVDVESFLSTTHERFDLVIADPPSFAPRESVVPKALKAYKALHRAALSVVAPGGFYLAASCSSHVHRPEFEETLREAAHALRLDLQVLERSGAGLDHPTPIGFPEGEYLTVTLSRVNGRA